jgi:hypothetical protein
MMGILTKPKPDPQEELMGILGNMGGQSGWQALTQLGAGLAGNADKGWGAGIGAGLAGAGNALQQGQGDRVRGLGLMAQLQNRGVGKTDLMRHYEEALKQGFKGNLIEFSQAMKGPGAIEAPSNVREWEYYNKLNPEQRQQYLTMKRAEKYLDTGTGFAQPNPAVPGETVRTIPKDIVGQKAAEARGASVGEAQASLASLNSKMPGLETVVRQLDDLSEKATYTVAGQVVDYARRQFGAEPRESAVARKQYVSLVDNQILPLLRDTFGAQFTQREGESLKATLGDPDASPKEKQAVLKAFIEQKRRNIEAAAAQAAGGAAPVAPPGGAVAGNDGWMDVGGVKIRVKQ